MSDYPDNKHTRWMGVFSTLLFCSAFVLINVHRADAKIPEGLRIHCVKIVNKTEANVCEKYSVDPGHDVGLEESLEIKVMGPSGVGDEGEDFNFKSLILFLDNQPLTDHHPNVEPEASTSGVTVNLTFKLKRNHTDEKSKEIWHSLLGSPTGLSKDVTVGVGLPDGNRIPANGEYKPGVRLELLGGILLTIATAIFVIAFVLFICLCKKSNVIRDAAGPNLAVGQKPPYSLGKTQMAWWFFLVLGSYLFISVATFDYETISAQALVLIGIAAGTGLGAVVINSGKSVANETELANARAELAKLDGSSSKLQTEYQALEAAVPKTTEQSVRLVAVAGEKEAIVTKRAQIDEQITKLEERLADPVSKTLFIDLVSDRSGVSFHRFQNVAWTVVLGIVFLFLVYQNLAMPEFSPTLLTLMGITSGTYLGFKFPEGSKSS